MLEKRWVYNHSSAPDTGTNLCDKTFPKLEYVSFSWCYHFFWLVCVACIFPKKRRDSLVQYHILQWLLLNRHIFQRGYIFWVKWDFAVLWAFFMLLNLFSARYTRNTICWLYIFTFFRDVLKFWNQNIFNLCECHPCY